MSLAAAAVLVFLVRVYRIAISPLLGAHCRYAPTCSLYAIDAIGRHGPYLGSRLALRRVLRCRPGCDGGFDPVPPAV